MDKNCTTRAKMELAEQDTMRVFLVLVGLAAAIAAAVWFSGARPVIAVARPPKAIGTATAVEVKVSSASGIRRFRARLEQGPQSVTLAEEASPVSRWRLWRAKRREVVYRLVAGRRTLPQLQDGPARIVLEAWSDDWRGAGAAATLDVTVRTRPPALAADSFQHYINQGGCEMVVLTVGPETAESGVRVGPYRFRSWPLPGGAAGSRFALFAFPYDVPPETEPVVFARDEAGNEATATFWHRVKPKKFRLRDLDLTPDFLEKVVRQFPPQSGDRLADFLRVNRDLRRQNNQQLADLRSKTEPRFLWTEPFRQLADSKVEAQFADHRRYYYQGQKVDEQDHLGFDLAVTANVAVVAANDGKVVWSEPLGIYGNCIVIDHGYGLQSIYGHLSGMLVKAGDMVRQGQTIGRSGSTGLAGGDHLHFSMQVDGVQVNPVEWWDPHWIQDRIRTKVPALLPAGGTAARSAAP